MAIFFVAIGIIIVLLSVVAEYRKGISSFKSIGIGQIFAGISIFMLYYFEKKKQYLTLKNGELIKHTLIPKRIKLSEIKSIREFAGDLKLIMERKEFVIDTQIIEPNSLAELRIELGNLNLG